MIKIIVVDDETESSQKTRDIINKELFNNKLGYEIKIYQTLTKGLQEEIEDITTPKIYILDIDLKSSLNGIQIAKIIRSKDLESNIIFLTSHEAMFEQVHRNLYNIFDFIEKFNDMEKRLTKDIKAIVSCNYDNKYFYYSYKNIELNILLKTINYIYRDTIARKLVIVTDNNQFQISENINDIINKLDKRFIQVHRSCIINKENVCEINWSQGYFKLKNGDIIYQVSKNYRGLK